MEMKDINSLFEEDGVAVILIDMQKKFFVDKELNDVDINDLIVNQIKVLKKCKKLNIPVIWVEYLNQGITLNSLKKQVELAQHKKITKKGMDAFKTTEIIGFKNNDLYKHLESLKVKKIFFMGVFAGVCVLVTALSAIKYGFEVASGPNYVAGYIGEDYFDNTYKYSGGIYD